ncbi:MAG: transketolase C-terminal domain-containing protein, partial [Chloroflexota bacterium]
SMVTIMTALYFHYLNRGDLVSVKPHASPVFHAIQYLLDQIPADYLPTLRQYGGLQAYPSRTKDPEPVDFSTGSVGLGAVAPLFSAYAERYTHAHFGPAEGQPDTRRFVAIIGDAELDEGNIWEALLDDGLSGLSNMLLIVDLNRQSLDRVVPGIKADRLKAMFADCNWQVIEAKYGSKLQEFFSMPNGERLRQRIDQMTNAEYQSIIRLPVEEMRAKVIQEDKALEKLLSIVPDEELEDLISNLGGHDFDELLSCLEEADREKKRPTVLFAYTIKGWGLPIAGHPLNHSMLLKQEEMTQLRTRLLPDAGDEWARFPINSDAGRLCDSRAGLLFADSTSQSESLEIDIPSELPISSKGNISTQQSFGRALVALSRFDELAKYMVTVSPDVSSSTNLTGWINKVQVFVPKVRAGYGQEHWDISETGQHVELGISEMNLFMALSMFGLTGDLLKRPLIPIGTVYDPFVCRGLDAFIYGLYSKSRFIIAGTPSGVSLSPEGGAHQSAVTSSLGMELPNLNFYEPCFAKEVAWLMLEAVHQCVDPQGRASYLRLSTKPIDQAPFEQAEARLGPKRLQEQVVAGGYRLRDWRDSDGVYKRYLVHLVTTGTMVPEALAAADQLEEEGIPANVINLTNPRKLYEAWQAQMRGESLMRSPFDWLIPASERHAPLIIINDAASHAQAWLGSVFGMLTLTLGVDKFGQSGTRQALYQDMGIDSESIVQASLRALNQLGLE